MSSRQPGLDLGGGFLSTIERHKISVVDPFLARSIKAGLSSHLEQHTISGYSTAARNYATFCKRRDLQPWPVQEIVFIGWLHVVTRAILTTSLDLYCAGVRDFQLSHFGSGSWDTIGKSELVLRTKRYLRKRYPTSPVASKFQVTLAVILRL
jgi:hypothetical protein